MNLWHEMKSRWDKTLASQPRWDGNRLAFTINTEGKRIPCAISRSALQNLSRHTHLATSDLLVMDFATRSRRSRPVFSTLRRNGYPARSAYGADDIDNPPPARAFAPREIVQFAIDGAAAAGSRHSSQDLI